MRYTKHLSRLGKILRHGLYWMGSACAILTDAVERRRLRARHQRGQLTHVRCLVPFTRLEFLGRGLVTSCCQAFTNVPSVGNMKRQTIEQIWNGRAIQRFRRRMLLGEVDRVCRPHCPFLSRPPILISSLKIDDEQGRLLKEDLEAGRTELRAAPVQFTLTNWGACNLRCVMCDNRTDAPMPAFVAKTHANLKNYFGREITLVLTGNGEALARKDIRDLLIHFPTGQYPKVRFEFLTNGLLWTPEFWEKIKHCRTSGVSVSIDAATRETYERIRRGGGWDTLMQSLDLFRRAREEGRLEWVKINMTVMRGNYREIPRFVALARRFGFGAYFTKIRGVFGDENIFEPPDRAALEELRTIMSDPDLYRDKMDFTQLAEFIPGRTPA